MGKFYFWILFFGVLNLSAQERKGNIVEYFGKEKVDDIHEGQLLHVFTDALIYKKEKLPTETEAVEYDSLFARFIGKDESGISKGENAGENNLGEPVKWEEIEVNENSEFNDSGLGSGYLYLEYESDSEKIVLFEASGHTSVLINGLPHEGDHYDFGYSLIPIKLEKGKNEFLLSSGRFSRIRARLIQPDKKQQFTARDKTLPDILKQEENAFPAAIRIVNSENKIFKNAKVVARIGKQVAETELGEISPLFVRKVPFEIPVPAELDDKEEVELKIELKDAAGEILDSHSLMLPVKSKYKHHKKTFISEIDGSVQYYSMAPSLDSISEGQAMFLSLHGASVEAVNQANAYKQKDWGHIVAPTNRRPFGFAWEDWGRLDALEVLNNAEDEWKTDGSQTYLTGHSMGGHGTWYLGATYPDKFAAIAPAAGYPDLLAYRESFMKRMAENPEMLQKRFNMSKDEFSERTALQLDSEKEKQFDEMIRRAGNPSRTLDLLGNYLHFGIYLLHGEVDSVVPTFIAREMRERLGQFHNDFTYYEYPEGTHWYGDHSMDWHLIFDYFKVHSKKPEEDLKKFSFNTASPGVSEKAHFIKILQQEKPFELSSFKFQKDSSMYWKITTNNIQTLELDLQKIKKRPDSISLDDIKFKVPQNKTELVLSKEENVWQFSKQPQKREKGPHRNGGFKDAFRNKAVLVYATHGNDIENEWYYHRAKYDAEKFYYRANGDLKLLADSEFNPSDYPDRNVIIYGNADNNSAWEKVLAHSPLQVSKNQMRLGTKTLTGNDFGAYYIYPREDSDFASIGVITATGEKGRKAAWANEYLLNATFYPDFMIFNDTMSKKGISGVKAAGFFDNSWAIDQENYLWRK